MTTFPELLDALHAERVQFVLIGVAGANFYAPSAEAVFTTQDRDLLLPLDPDNLLKAWRGCEAAGLELTAGDEPLDRPRDRWLAERIVERRALVRATDGDDLYIDLTLVMGDFGFADVRREQQVFREEGRLVPVARLLHIVRSKAQAGRPKDRLFLATHAEALQNLLGGEIPYEAPPAEPPDG